MQETISAHRRSSRCRRHIKTWSYAARGTIPNETDSDLKGHEEPGDNLATRGMEHKALRARQFGQLGDGR